MLIYRHLLLTTDLSNQKNKIGETARHIALKSQAKLSLVHVLEYTPIVYGGGEFSIPIDLSLEEQLRHRATRALTNLGKSYDIAEEDQYLLSGSVKKEIIQLATTLHVDLIVVGSHSHGSMSALIGSTANAILHAAKCDVLAVRA